MYAVLLFLVWIIINGRITPEVCIIGAVLSVGIYLFAKAFIPKDTQNGYRLTYNPIKLLSYFLYVLVQIFISNIKTISCLINPLKRIKPVLVFFEIELKTEIAKTILANSITITPGTITVSIRDNLVCVHVFDESMSEGVENNGFLKRLMEMEVAR